MTEKENETIGLVICKMFETNNKALTIALGDCPGIETAKILAESISREIFTSYKILQNLIQPPSHIKHTGREMSVREFIHSPRMGG